MIGRGTEQALLAAIKADPSNGLLTALRAFLKEEIEDLKVQLCGFVDNNTTTALRGKIEALKELDKRLDPNRAPRLPMQLGRSTDY